MSAEASSCPRCGAARRDAGRSTASNAGCAFPARERLRPTADRGPCAPARIGGLALLACAGAAVAIAVTADDAGAGRVLTATGGSVTAPHARGRAGSRLAVWPRVRSGWTIVLASIPKASGRDEAVAVAQQARTRRPRRVGVLDSSRFASLRPGYWMTFSGAVPERARRDRLPPACARRGQGRARAAHRALSVVPDEQRS